MGVPIYVLCVYMYLYIMCVCILYGSVFDPGFHASCIHQTEHKPQCHKHLCVIYIYSKMYNNSIIDVEHYLILLQNLVHHWFTKYMYIIYYFTNIDILSLLSVCVCIYIYIMCIRLIEINIVPRIFVGDTDLPPLLQPWCLRKFFEMKIHITDWVERKHFHRFWHLFMGKLFFS